MNAEVGRCRKRGEGYTMRLVLGIYAALGFLLWFVPLFNLLHAESSAVVATVAFFVAGFSSLRLFDQGQGVGEMLLRQEAALLVSWCLLTVTLLWVPNCGYGQGLLFFLLFPPASVVLAVALAYALSGMRIRLKKTIFVSIGLAVLLLGTLYDLGLHPQFYTYNHVYGGVLGPIYDEEFVIQPGLLVFRGLTLLWAALFLLIGARLRGHRGWLGQGGVVVVAVLIGLAYLGSDWLGFNTTSRRIERTLGSVMHTEHFDLYYDPASLDSVALRLLAEDHEYRYAQLAEALDLEVPERIASYLYPDPETKAALTGARYTNVAPVWLPRPQVHVLLDAYEPVFPHELAHVFSREFGLPVLNASVAVGLVEGLAVALEPPDGLPTPHEQVSVVLTQRRLQDAAAAPDLAGTLASRLSLLGFWTGRGAVSYTTMGSFVLYLLDAYGAERLKRVYAWAKFESVYGKPLAVLTAEWQAYVEALPVVDRAAGGLAQRRFSIPSLFEKPCPHYVPPYRRAYQQGVAALADGDSAEALHHFEDALAYQPAYQPALLAWGLHALAEGGAGAVVARLDTLAPDQTAPSLSVLVGDAYGVLGHPVEARAWYDTALQATPAYAHEQAALLVLRKSLASHPDILKIITGGSSISEKVARLDTLRDAPPAVEMLVGLLWLCDGYGLQAAKRLRTAPPVDASGIPSGRQQQLALQRLGWIAEAFYRGGDLTRATAYATEAARAFRQAGALNASARWLDFVDKIRWLQQHASHSL